MKSEDEIFKFNLQKTIRSKARKPQVRTRTLSGNLSLKPYDNIVQFINPGNANRDVTLLPDIHYKADIYFIIYNRASEAYDLTIKDYSGTTIITISQDEGAIIFCWKEPPPSTEGEWRAFKGGKT